MRTALRLVIVIGTLLALNPGVASAEDATRILHGSVACTATTFPVVTAVVASVDFALVIENRCVAAPVTVYFEASGAALERRGEVSPGTRGAFYFTLTDKQRAHATAGIASDTGFFEWWVIPK
jgi:hypothetical protein